MAAEHGLNVVNTNAISMPFYEPPSWKTSAEIINEARLAIRDSHHIASTSIKPLQTKRPFTPLGKERLLFGKRTKNRPPSSFSLKYLQSEADCSIPSTTPENEQLRTSHESGRRHQRANSLAEIADGRIFNVGVLEAHPKIRLPSLDDGGSLQRRHCSLDKLSETEGKPWTRNAFSSPQERTDRQKKLGAQCLLLGPHNLNGILPPPPPALTSNIVIQCLNRESASQPIDASAVLGLLSSLYTCLDAEGPPHAIDAKTKVGVLKCLYKFVESKDEALLLALARIILALKVTGSNLAGVCKLIFKVAKNDRNDELFGRENLLELFVDAIGRSSPLDDAEACVYGYGAIKFLTLNAELLQQILALGILPLMVLHLKLANNAVRENLAAGEQTSHAVFQLTGALRNVAADEDVHEQFAAARAIPELCAALEAFATDADVVSNAARILSTVSTHAGCCGAIASSVNVHNVLVTLFERYATHDEIVVRLAYTLGNMVASLDSVRVQFYNASGSMLALLRLWSVYLERTLQYCALELENVHTDSANSQDVMIKIIRIIANMAINPEIGKAMNNAHGPQLIDELLKVLISKPFKQNDELVLSVLSTLNNLSFYYSPDLDEDIFHIKQIDIMEAISEYIAGANRTNAIEATRILGNLSRSKITRDYVAERTSFDALVNLLDDDGDDDDGELQLVKTTAGVFVNLMADARSRRLFQERDGVARLLAVLRAHAAAPDWTLAMLVCQVLWNYSESSANLYDVFSDAELQRLIALLVDFLDEEKLFGGSGASAGDAATDDDDDAEAVREYAAWEEFAHVGASLLEKLEGFIERLDVERARLERHLAAFASTPAPKVDSSTNISFSAW